MIAQGYPGGGDLTALKALTAAGATVVHPLAGGRAATDLSGYKFPVIESTPEFKSEVKFEAASSVGLPKDDGSKEWLVATTSANVAQVKATFKAAVDSAMESAIAAAETAVEAAKAAAKTSLVYTASGRKVKLGEGHEVESIKKAREIVTPAKDWAPETVPAKVPGNPADHTKALKYTEKLYLAIAATKMFADKDAVYSAAMGAAPTNQPKPDFIKIAEAADFAYLSDQGKECGDLDDCMICGLLACFLEFHVYGGVAASTDGKLEEDKTDLLQSWGHFKSKQVGFAAFVTTKKLLDAGATPRLADPNHPKVGMDGIKEAGTAWGAFIKPYDDKLNQAQTKPTTFCALVTVIETRCKVHHAGIKAVCT